MDNPVYDVGTSSTGELGERELDNPIYGLATESDSTVEGAYDMPADFDTMYSSIDT